MKVLIFGKDINLCRQFGYKIKSSKNIEAVKIVLTESELIEAVSLYSPDIIMNLSDKNIESITNSGIKIINLPDNVMTMHSDIQITNPFNTAEITRYSKISDITAALSETPSVYNTTVTLELLLNPFCLKVGRDFFKTFNNIDAVIPLCTSYQINIDNDITSVRNDFKKINLKSDSIKIHSPVQYFDDLCCQDGLPDIIRKYFEKKPDYSSGILVYAVLLPSPLMKEVIKKSSSIYVLCDDNHHYELNKYIEEIKFYIKYISCPCEIKIIDYKNSEDKNGVERIRVTSTDRRPETGTNEYSKIFS